METLLLSSRKYAEIDRAMKGVLLSHQYKSLVLSFDNIDVILEALEIGLTLEDARILAGRIHA